VPLTVDTKATSNAGGDRSLHLSSVDEYLGPSSSRFFGSGYRRVTYRFGDLRFESSTSHVHGIAGADYPEDWSRKAHSNTRPHLSTIDALVFATRLTDLLLTQYCGLDDEQRRWSWLRKGAHSGPVSHCEPCRTRGPDEGGQRTASWPTNVVGW
jgi:hypothetical protein